MGATDSKDLSLALVLLRRVREWTQDDLAAAAGLAASTVCEYETGKTEPSPRNLAKILSGLRFPPPLLDAFLALIRSLRLVMTVCDAVRTGQLPDSLESVAQDAGRAISEFLRAELSLALASAVPAAEAPPSKEDHRGASDLWSRLESLPHLERLGLIRNGKTFRNWALAVLLCEASVESAAKHPRQAVDLAELALEIARLAPVNAAFRARLLGYVLAFLGNARRVAGDLPAAEEAFGRSREASPANAEWDDLLDLSRRFDLEASLRTSQRRFADALDLLDLALATCPPEAVARILVKKAKTQEELRRF